jgi:ABC-type glycerol-3-phosphate transport system substrate-binding protein
LRLLVVDDPGLADAVERQWRARAEGEIEVRQMTTEELLGERRRRLATDAVVYPSGLIGELAERGYIVSIADDVVNDRAESGPRFARRDIFELIRQREITWGEHVYAVPLGSPTLVLFYRRDLFEELGLDAPASWAEYQQLASRLSRREDLGDAAPPGESPWYGVIEPLGSGWAGQMLLARAAVYARHRSYLSTIFDLDTMEPVITAPPFVRALQELVAAARFGPADAMDYSPDDVRRELFAGHCAMAVTWPSRAGSDNATDASQHGEQLLIGIAGLPSSREVYHPGDAEWQDRGESETGQVTLLGVAGRLGSVTKASRQPQAALGLLLRISGSDWSEHISPHSPATTLFRTRQMAAAESWMDEGFEAVTARQYAELARQIHRQGLWLSSVRIPGRTRYLAALDGAVRQAVQGDQSPTDCLKAAADKWAEITAEYGMEAQKAAYWRSLGMEPK